MTNNLPPSTSLSAITASQAKRRKKRARADKRFKFYGQAAIGFSLLMLVVLISAIGMRSVSAFTSHSLSFSVFIDPALATPKGNETSGEISANVFGFFEILKNDLYTQFNAETRDEREALRGLMTRLAVLPLARKVAKNPELVGTRLDEKITLSDNIDLFLEQRDALETSRVVPDTAVFLSDIRSDPAFDGVDTVFILDGQTITRYGRTPSLPTWDVTGTTRTNTPTNSDAKATAYWLSLNEGSRNFSDLQYAYILHLEAQTRIYKSFNRTMLTNVDSTYPELAGILAAFVGSLLTMMITALVAIPIGVAASIYLEEFAKSSRINSIIEININNLAAVPSILFGLLGAAFLIDNFGMPRSAPLVGGIVLGLLVLPTIIIASRSALRSVPNDLRAAALGIGASKMQTVTHHVLPLAIPGMLTGAILAMARALGETAPLILIGMVAFVAQVPNGVTDGATALPVLVYRWATLSERAWEPLTAAAIIILLLFLIVMNLTAVLIRRYFERKA